MQKDLVSVIIPSYNHENYVKDTIESIIAQTYKNIELIVIDDGSKDSTWQKIQEMRDKCEERFIKVHFETKENEGTCKTLNKLLSLAQGEFIYLIASDDLAKPQAIENEINFLISNPDYALVVGDNEIIDGEGKACYWDKTRNNVYDIKKAKYKTFCDFLKQNRKDIDFNSKQFGNYQSLYVGNYIPNGYLIRKSIFEKIGYFTPEAPLEDYWLMLQISKYSKMKYLDEVLFYYRWHNANTIKNVEKIRLFTDKTSELEEKILSKVNENEVLPDVITVKKQGVCYKAQGIPFLFQTLTYKKSGCKRKIIKLFNIKIFEYKK